MTVPEDQKPCGWWNPRWWRTKQCTPLLVLILLLIAVKQQFRADRAERTRGWPSATTTRTTPAQSGGYSGSLAASPAPTISASPHTATSHEQSVNDPAANELLARAHRLAATIKDRMGSRVERVRFGWRRGRVAPAE